MNERLANTRMNEREYREGRLVLRSWPRNIDLGLTLKCNLRCVMCISRHLGAADLDAACLDRVEPYLQFCDQVIWSDAGELLASGSTPRFLELINRCRPRTSYVSSNFLLADRYMDSLVGGGLTSIGISIDAVCRETYEAIRIGGSWDKLMANLELLRAAKAAKATPWPRVTFVFVPMRRNLDELPAYVDFARGQGAVRVEVLRMTATPGGFEKAEAPTLDEERAAYKKALARADELGFEIQHSMFPNWVLLDEIRAERGSMPDPSPAVEEPPAEQVEPDPIPPAMDSAEAAPISAAPAPCVRPPLESLHGRRFDIPSGRVPVCPAPWSGFFVQTDGKVRACCKSDRVLGDLHEQTLPEIWNGPGYRDFRLRMLLGGDTSCVGCDHLVKVHAGGVTEPDLSVERLPEIRATNEWLESCVRDADSLEFYWKLIKGMRLKSALKRTPGAVVTAVRTVWRTLTIGSVLARSWTLQRHLNRMLAWQNQALREEVDALAEAVVAGRRDGVSEGGANVIDPAQTPADGLFYSAVLDADATPRTMKRGGTLRVTVRVHNTSAVNWPVVGDHSVKVAYNWLDRAGDVHTLDGLRTHLPSPPQPGESVEVSSVVKAPDEAGAYVLRWDLVYDPHAWFQSRGNAPTDIEVRVE